MKILAVDSSSATASAAVVKDGKTVAEFFVNAGLTHSETLAPMIKSILDCSATRAEDIDLYAVTVGPGSFTGLRIGLSTIKAMALANNKPCVGISSLHALALNTDKSEKIVCACMDARRGGVYNAIFEVKGGKIIRITQDRAIYVEDLIAQLRNSSNVVEFVGDGALICYNSMASGYSTDNISLISEKDMYIKSSNVALTAEEMYNQGIFDDACSLSPSYIRVPQAERLLNENKLKV